ncbi:MAG: MBL fold metallo-hydrolase [Kiritimatiellae bacterium]|nr:MBL fold metallo-hydrolase [Kiritimatiellia bacterium]
MKGIKRRGFLATAAGALASGVFAADTETDARAAANVKRNCNPEIMARIDAWEGETDLTKSEDYARYRRDGKTRGLVSLEKVERAFEKVFREVKETKVESIPAVWSVYNMGYVVKTPQSVFAIDLVHRRAREFAPILDFALVTHNHGDHFHGELYSRLDGAGKVVISNFLDNYGVWGRTKKMSGGGYTRAEKEFVLKDVRIRTSLVDHNSYLIDFTTAFEIRVGDWTLFHTGDCGVSTKLRTTWGSPDLWLFFPMGSIDVADAVRRVRPKRVVFGHLWELGHKTGRLKAPLIKRSLKAASPFCGDVAPAFWGDRII